MVLVCVDKPELDTDVAWKLRCLPDARVKHEFYKFFFIRKKKKSSNSKSSFLEP